MNIKNSEILIDETYNSIRNVLVEARVNVTRAVNIAIVHAYWQIGRIIVEDEQKGKERAGYGKALIDSLSLRLVHEFGKGFTPRNLRNMRQFYLYFPIWHPMRAKSTHPLNSVVLNQQSHDKKTSKELSALRSELSWTHYKLLIRIENPLAREWYMNEAADCGWSTRALERQINSFYYERILASKNKDSVRKEADNKIAALAPEEVIKDPYVLEFLNLKDRSDYHESELEQALIDKLQDFLLELGKGFSFVARQQRILAEDENFYIDLVFYNYLLKCFILIELTIEKLSHKDIGQMDMYVRMYEDKFKVEGDNPTIGIILCSEKNEAVAKYSILNESKQIFASKYQLYLPTEAELEEELRKERRLLEERGVSKNRRSKKNIDDEIIKY